MKVSLTSKQSNSVPQFRKTKRFLNLRGDRIKPKARKLSHKIPVTEWLILVQSPVKSSFTPNDLIYSQRKTIANHERFIAKALVGELTIRFGSADDLNFFPIQKSDFDIDKIVASQTTCDYCVHFRLHSCADTFHPLIMIYGLHCPLQIRRNTLATRSPRPQSRIRY